jgi:DNA-binding response OmpR family regulator
MQDAPPSLIVADRDEGLRKHITGQLLADGCAAEPAGSAAEVRCRAASGRDMLILGELDEPTTALELLREFRAGDALDGRLDPWLPVLVVSGSPGEWVPLRAFEAGCDDFLRLSLSYLELRARVRAILRRKTRTREEPAPSRGTRDRPRPAGGTLRRQAARALPARVRAPVRAGERTVADLHEARAAAATRTLDAHACRLRRKLERAGPPGHVVNRRGVGYRLVDRSPAPLASQRGHGERPRRARRAGPYRRRGITQPARGVLPPHIPRSSAEAGGAIRRPPGPAATASAA